MSRKCEISGKGPMSGNTRSHALNATKKKQSVNLQKMTLNGETVIVSAREARTLKKKAN